MSMDMKEEIEGRKRRGRGQETMNWIIAAWKAEEVVSPSGGN